MKTIELTLAEAVAKFLAAQKIMIKGEVTQLFGCCFAIFGHGNVTCFSEQLKKIESIIPTWRGQNEQSMALAATAFAKANRRQRIGIATSSIGPGAGNMVTAAGVAHTNRLPLLLISGDYYASRLPDPVLQQTEHFHDPTISTNDAFKAVTRFWDRITHPEQILLSLPHALDVMLDPATAGPAFLAIPQDVWGHTFHYPEAFFEEKIHRIRKPQPERLLIDEACALIRKAKKPLVIAGGGIHYADAYAQLRLFVETHNIPLVETIAGRAVIYQTHPLNCGPLGVTGSNSANTMAAEADVIIAIGTRLQDFTTGSWSVFRQDELHIISLNVQSFDAIKHRGLPVIGDAKVGLEALMVSMGEYYADTAWSEKAKSVTTQWQAEVKARTTPKEGEMASYAHVVGAVNRLIDDGDTVVTAAGGLPAELAMNWQSKQLGKIDIEFGYSCMGYEIAGGWGIKIANPHHDAIVLVGDGSYMMMNSDIYSTVLTGNKIIVIVCDNAGFAVINKLQVNTGNQSFNNLLKDCTTKAQGAVARVDFQKHAEAMGALSIKIQSMQAFDEAFAQSKASDRTAVIVVDIDPDAWSSCDCWWEVGLPEITRSSTTQEAVEQWNEKRQFQRAGV